MNEKQKAITMRSVAWVAIGMMSFITLMGITVAIHNDNVSDSVDLVEYEVKSYGDRKHMVFKHPITSGNKLYFGSGVDNALVQLAKYERSENIKATKFQIIIFEKWVTGILISEYHSVATNLALENH